MAPLSGKTVSSMFNMKPPSIEDYLHLDENHLVYLEDNDDIPLGYTYDYGGKRVIYDISEDITVNTSD